MSKKPRNSKIRTEFKKNSQSRRRTTDLTRKFQQESLDDTTLNSHERVSGKGDLTRRRTIVGHLSDEADGLAVEFASDDPTLQRGRVLRMHGLECVVRSEAGKDYRCAVRQVLKSISTDQRQAVVAGDWVGFRPEGEYQGIIISVGTRHGVISRTSRGRRHVLVSNVDQMLIVASAREPDLKPHLIDRFLICAEQSQVEPFIVINKCDLLDPAELQPLVGVYAQMGYRTLLTSAEKGWGIDTLRSVTRNKQTVVVGQSGVGKSSILNAIEVGLALRVQSVSTENWKGKHTTTTAELISLQSGGYMVDTPGIRQLELWDVSPEEVSGLFRDIRPWINLCRFPDCTHMHEVECGVRDAVADGKLDPRRYDSYVHLIEDPSAAT